MTVWSRFGMQDKILNILKSKMPYASGHHFGRPFLTPYQIAIDFKKDFPTDFRSIGKALGGERTGKHVSLPQYIANELSKKIKAGKMPSIEGRFLAREHRLRIKLTSDAGAIESSQSYDLSIYRWREGV